MTLPQGRSTTTLTGVAFSSGTCQFIRLPSMDATISMEMSWTVPFSIQGMGKDSYKSDPYLNRLAWCFCERSSRWSVYCRAIPVSELFTRTTPRFSSAASSGIKILMQVHANIPSPATVGLVDWQKKGLPRSHRRHSPPSELKLTDPITTRIEVAALARSRARQASAALNHQCGVSRRAGTASAARKIIALLEEDIELIVIDGGSDDGSIDILRHFDDSIDHWISEPDSGIPMP